MGAWGMQPLENDTALDFTGSLFRKYAAGDLSLLSEAFQDVFRSRQDDYLDSDIGSTAIAAAAILVSLQQGNAEPLLEIQPQGQAWFDAAKQANYQTLIPDALEALELVTAENSELYELWAETGYFKEWLDSVNKIRDVLTSS